MATRLFSTDRSVEQRRVEKDSDSMARLFMLASNIFTWWGDMRVYKDGENSGMGLNH